MNKGLQLYGSSRTNFGYLLLGQRTLQNSTRKANLLEEGHTLGIDTVCLRRGVQLHTKPHTTVGHILHNQRIDTRLDKGLGLTLRIVELGIEEQRVAGCIDLRTKTMGILHNTGNILDAVTCGIASAKTRRSDIDGIGSAINGIDGRKVVFGRRKQLYMANILAHLRQSY